MSLTFSFYCSIVWDHFEPSFSKPKIVPILLRRWCHKSSYTICNTLNVMFIITTIKKIYDTTSYFFIYLFFSNFAEKNL